MDDNTETKTEAPLYGGALSVTMIVITFLIGLGKGEGDLPFALGYGVGNLIIPVVCSIIYGCIKSKKTKGFKYHFHWLFVYSNLAMFALHFLMHLAIMKDMAR